MMRKLLATLLLLLSATSARAGVPCALPFNLQNGTPADATQVMANYNAIITCLGNAAAAGVNSDITALTGLSSPLTPANGGTSTFIATATSTGSGNAQIVAATTPTGFTLTPGYNVVFIAGFTNTGNTTLQVGNATATNVFRRTTDGAVPVVGGEIIAGTVTVLTYDGTNFQLLTNTSLVPIGTVLMGFFATADPGFVIMVGQCLSTTGIYNSLWNHVGAPGPTGGCGTGQFHIPDGRGRVMAQIDSGGSNNITAAGGNFDGTVLGNFGGVQNKTLGLNELPTHTHVATVTDPGHTHNVSGAITSAGSGANLSGGGGTYGFNTLTTTSSTTGISVSNASAGSGNPFSTLQPTMMVNMELKY